MTIVRGNATVASSAGDFMHTSRLLGLIVPLVLTACASTAVPATPCGDMCDQLVSTCSYAAFPSMESCLQGCEFDSTNGRDVDGQQECVADAECNTFDIVECEHAYE